MLRMVPTDTPTPSPALRFKNFKGGDYRAKTDGATYRLRKITPEDWVVELQVDDDPAWMHATTATSREDAESAATAHNTKHDPAQLQQQVAQRRAVAQVAAACAQRRGLTAQLDHVNDTLTEAVRAAFAAGCSAGPLLEVTAPVGITTRNRLYQIRDGHR